MPAAPRQPNYGFAAIQNLNTSVTTASQYPGSLDEVIGPIVRAAALGHPEAPEFLVIQANIIQGITEQFEEVSRVMEAFIQEKTSWTTPQVPPGISILGHLGQLATSLPISCVFDCFYEIHMASVVGQRCQ